jgi:hypothetical protein
LTEERAREDEAPMSHTDFEQALTLPAWLAVQARTRGAVVALRRKSLGLWRAWTWRQVADEVSRVASSLAAHGFARGDRVVIAGEPRPEALLLAFAAQWLGGAAVCVDLGGPAGSLDLGAPRPQFAFVEHGGQFALLERLADGAPFDRVVYGDPRGVVPSPDARLIAYEALAAFRGPIDPPRADPGDLAFAFARRVEAAGPAPPPCAITHREALAGARALLRDGAIGADHDALAPRSQTPEFARAFVGSWLVAGFRLHFPEKASTRDVDRRELSPSLVIGTADSYARLRQRVTENLPAPRSPQRRLVDWALAPSTTGLDELLRRTAGEALVRRPLREVIGLSRVELLLVAGAAPEASVAAFFSRLGLELRSLDDAGASAAAVRERAADLEQPSGSLPVAGEAS